MEDSDDEKLINDYLNADIATEDKTDSNLEFVNVEELSDFESDQEDDCTEEANQELGNRKILPKKSKQAYEATYKAFMEWRKKNVKQQDGSFSERVLLDYFEELTEKFKSPLSFWRTYSMLKSTLNVYHGVDIEKYTKLRAFLSLKNKGYTAKQSKVFNLKDVNKFLTEAPDEYYLGVKVGLILGIMGACSAREIHSITMNDIQDSNSALLINIPTRTKNQSFIIEGQFYAICKRYMSLRPENSKNSSFFLCYQNGKCFSQTVGINTLSLMGKVVAKYLKLPDPNNYTGRSFLKSSVNVLKEIENEAYESQSFTTKPSVFLSESLEAPGVPKNETDSEDVLMHESDVSDTDVDDLDMVEGSEIKPIPERSKQKYELVYNGFMYWRRVRNINSFSEDILLTYFKELSKKYATSSLFLTCSMLKTTLWIYHKVNIKTYSKLRLFLKKNAEGFQAKKTKTFTPFEINKFINEAPNYVYHATKVVLIMGVVGACGKQELRSLTTENIQDFGTAMFVTVSSTRGKHSKRFKITDHLYDICKRYLQLRPPHAETNNLFLNYQKGRCTIQHIGINKIGTMATQVAKYLKLSNPEMYTGLSFRKTAEKLIRMGGVIAALKECENWNCISLHSTDDMMRSYSSDRSRFSHSESESGMSSTDIADSSILTMKCDLSGTNESHVQREHSFTSEDDTIITPSNSSTPVYNLPYSKSKKRYERTYKNFMDWRNRKKLNTFSEDVFLAYFEELSEMYASTSLWNIFFMLSTTIRLHHNVSLRRSPKLYAYLKQKFMDYRFKITSKQTFSHEQINKFLTTAPDNYYLVIKVALVIGVTGSCSNHELHSLRIQDVEDLGSAMLITVPRSEGTTFRKFLIADERHYQICKKYTELRPADIDFEAYFLRSQKGKYVAQHIGRDTFGKMGACIANFLKLANATLYKGNCFRRIAQSGISLIGERSRGTDLMSAASSQNCEEESDPLMLSSVPKNVVGNDRNQCGINCTEEGFRRTSQKLEKDNMNQDMLQANSLVDESMEIDEFDKECVSVMIKSETVNSSSEDEEDMDFVEDEALLTKCKSSYKAFIDWHNHQNISSFSEDVFLVYFKELLEKNTPPLELYQEYYRLKREVFKNHKVVLKNYTKLRGFLKCELDKYENKNEGTFNADEMNRFLNEAPDCDYLATKVAITIGIMSRCTIDELQSIAASDVQDFGSAMLVTLRKVKLNTVEKFTITDGFYQTCKKYADLRPDNAESGSFFLNYQNGKCTLDSMNRNKFEEMGKEIATFLKLSNSEVCGEYNFPTFFCGLIVQDGKIVNRDDINTIKEECFSSDCDSDTEMEDIEMYDSLPDQTAAFSGLEEKNIIPNIKSEISTLHNPNQKSTSVHESNLSEITSSEFHVENRNIQENRIQTPKMFSFGEVNKFISEADDEVYLTTKVASVMGLVGDCSIHELYSLTVKDVQDAGTVMLVTIREQDSIKIHRKFLVTDSFYQICKKYTTIRPPGADSTSFFLTYRNGKVTTEDMDISVFEAIGKQIAMFLQLPNLERYTKESFPKLSSIVIFKESTESNAQKEPVNNIENITDHSYLMTTNVGDTKSMVIIKEEESFTEDDLCDENFTPQHSSVDASVLTFKEEIFDSDDDDSVVETNELTTMNQLPEKSRQKYQMAYNTFMDWCSNKNIKSLSENVLVDYFQELSQKYKPLSLWTLYSMLRSTLNMYQNVSLKNYSKLREFLKSYSADNPSKHPSKTFTAEQINRFLTEAPDEKYLVAKVILIIGVTGALDRRELHSLNIDDIQDFGSAMLVTLRKNKANKLSKTFTIADDYYRICKKYLNLRPSNVKRSSFFLAYHGGKCTSQNIGINTFGAIVRHIAEYLKLPDPEAYTGRVFRKSSVKLFS